MESMNQITKTLPKSAWQGVIIKENNEPLFLVEQTSRLIVADKNIFLRKKVVEMLHEASLLLPDHLGLYIIEGVRSIEEQQKRWDRDYKKIQLEFPDRDASFWDNQTGLLVARPLPLANHNCGGAVDVQVIDMLTKEFLDMGTPAQSGFGFDNTKMFSELITDDQKHNRTILREVMESVGFVWYPGEWWHYCYGDRMWAVYTNRNECMYGPIQDIV